MEMSIAALSVGMHQQELGRDLGISVLKMAMGDMEDIGSALTEMAGDTKALELSAQPYLGANIDIGA